LQKKCSAFFVFVANVTNYHTKEGVYKADTANRQHSLRTECSAILVLCGIF